MAIGALELKLTEVLGLPARTLTELLLVAGPAELVNPVPGNRDVFTTILESVTQSIASSAKGTGLAGASLLDAVSEVVAGASREAVERGGDLIGASLPSLRAADHPLIYLLVGNGSKRGVVSPRALRKHTI